MTARPSDLQTFRPSDFQTFRLSDPQTMKTYHHNDLLNFTTRVFMQIGCSRDDAAAVAAVLVAAELRGHSSHGMIRVREYYELWKSGRVNVTPDA